LADGRSRLARRAKQHAARELRRLGVTVPTPDQAAQARDVGTLLALRDMVTAGLGRDPKATVRKVTAIAKSAAAERRALRGLVPATGGRPVDLASRMAQHYRERDDGA
jgi:hypothetical protein